MIKFFRKIRQRMLTENLPAGRSQAGKFSKYLLYAIGEILLVVIGILIAVTINDHNQDRINKKEEISLLKSIKEDFIETKNRAQETIDKQSRVVNYCSRLEAIMFEKNNNVNIDSIGIFISVGALSYWRIEPVNGTYDAIIGSGKISILQNKKLKRLLAEFSAEIKYGFEDENYCIELTTLLAEKSSEYFYFLLPKHRQKGRDLKREVHNTERKKALTQHLNNSSFLGILNSKTEMEDNRLEYQQNILKTVENILTEIEPELKN